VLPFPRNTGERGAKDKSKSKLPSLTLARLRYTALNMEGGTMQLRLQTAMCLLAVSPPALAWVWINLALITPLVPLLSYAALGAAIVTLFVLGGDSD